MAVLTSRSRSIPNIAGSAIAAWHAREGSPFSPPGKAPPFPAAIPGVFVADSAFNVNAVTKRDARLQDHPITIWMEEGRAVKFECADSAVSQFLDESFRTHCAYNV